MLKFSHIFATTQNFSWTENRDEIFMVFFKRFANIWFFDENYETAVVIFLIHLLLIQLNKYIFMYYKFDQSVLWQINLSNTFICMFQCFMIFFLFIWLKSFLVVDNTYKIQEEICFLGLVVVFILVLNTDIYEVKKPTDF